MNGMAPRYLGPFVRVADLPAGRRALRSAVTNRLAVPAVIVVIALPTQSYSINYQ